MCQSIYLTDEKVQIDTVAQFIDRFGNKLVWDGSDGTTAPKVEGKGLDALNHCLCGYDLEKTAVACGYEQLLHDGDPMESIWTDASHHRGSAPQEKAND
jgi:hypothetical protein